MYKLRQNKAGFGAVEVLLVIVLVVLIGVMGWLVYRNHHRSTTTNSANTATTKSITSAKKPTATSATKPSQPVAPDPYAGWKTAVLQYEKIAYRYPPNWTVVDASQATPKSQNDCTYPGHDIITLKSPSGTQVAFNAGEDCFGDAGVKAFGSVPITALGRSLYLVFEGNIGAADSNSTDPSDACLAQSTNPHSSLDFKSKNIFVNSSSSNDAPVNSFCYLPYNPSHYSGAAPTFSVQQIETSADYSTAKLIFESMHY